ncbi:MAG: hypothetical protein ACFFBD_08235 [Candidatus Hodarchaeota archaeon]
MDGDLEVIIGAYDHRLWVWLHDGMLMDGWPQLTGTSNLAGIMATPAVANLDPSDETPEIAVGTKNNSLYAWHANGNLVSGFPVATNGGIQSSAALGDIDSDSDFEIVLGFANTFGNGGVIAFHHTGQMVLGFPYNTSEAVQSTPVLGDFSGDGDIEIIFGCDNEYVHVIDLPGVFNPENCPWPQFHYDAQNLGYQSNASILSADNPKVIPLLAVFVVVLYYKSLKKRQ